MGLLAALPWAVPAALPGGGPSGVWLRSTPPGRPLRGPNLFLTQPWRAGRCCSPSPCPPERPSPGLPLGSGAGGGSASPPHPQGRGPGPWPPPTSPRPSCPFQQHWVPGSTLQEQQTGGRKVRHRLEGPPRPGLAGGVARGWPLSRGWQGGGPSLSRGRLRVPGSVPGSVGTARTPVTLFPSSLIFPVPPMLLKPPPARAGPPAPGPHVPPHPAPSPGVQVL